MLARPGPSDSTATKNVFISAVQFATSLDGPCPILCYGPRLSAQEQVEYMLANGDCMLADHDIASEARSAISRTLSSFERHLLEPSDDDGIVRALSDLEWVCGVSPRLGLMAHFVSGWINVSDSILQAVEARKLGPCLREGLVRVVSKVLDAVGYGSVIVPAPSRVRLVRLWLPFVRGSRGAVGGGDAQDMWEGVEGSIVSIVSGLPSDDQAEILAEWMSGGDRARYPDLREVFEVWCFRSKSAKRRLGGGRERQC